MKKYEDRIEGFRELSFKQKMKVVILVKVLDFDLRLRWIMVNLMAMIYGTKDRLSYEAFIDLLTQGLKEELEEELEEETE